MRTFGRDTGKAEIVHLRHAPILARPRQAKNGEWWRAAMKQPLKCARVLRGS